MREMTLSTAETIVIFMTDSSDHITGKASLTLTITASKGGAAFAGISPTVTDLGSGWYAIALTTTHTNTLGDLALHITASGADASDVAIRIIGFSKTAATVDGNVTKFGGTSGTFASGRPEVNVNDKTGFKLASDGLDTVSTTPPTGVASTFREMTVQTWWRGFKKLIYDSSTNTTKLYAADGTTVQTTQSATVSGTTQTQGAAS